jgi:hypothetical protein
MAARRVEIEEQVSNLPPWDGTWDVYELRRGERGWTY